MSIEVRNVSKNFNAFKALNSINLDIQSGELVALLGPSGCGKTTLLRIIAGLETPDDGSIVFHGEDVSGHDVRDRNVGFVFQHYALFRHMTVFDNVAFGARINGYRGNIAELVERSLRRAALWEALSALSAQVLLTGTDPEPFAALRGAAEGLQTGGDTLRPDPAFPPV